MSSAESSSTAPASQRLLLSQSLWPPVAATEASSALTITSPTEMTSASPLAARLLCRLQLSLPQLMADFPPRWQHSAKQRIYDAVHRPASLHSAVPCVFSRYQSQPQLPPLLPLPARATVHSHQQDVYSYPPADNLPPVSGAAQSSASPVVWHVNFADRLLFGYYSSALFAQDELQVSEHPCLASLAEFLLVAAREWADDADDSKRAAQPYTAVAQGYSDRIITPCLIMNARREASLDCDELYGHKLQSASQAVLSRAVHPVIPPSFSHIIAMSAPTPRGEGSRYSQLDLQCILNTALTAFTAAVSESQHYLQQPYTGHSASEPAEAEVVIHTGNWGCGGQNSQHRSSALPPLLPSESVSPSLLPCLTCSLWWQSGCDGAAADGGCSGRRRDAFGVSHSAEQLDCGVSSCTKAAARSVGEQSAWQQHRLERCCQRRLRSEATVGQIQWHLRRQ